MISNSRVNSQTIAQGFLTPYLIPLTLSVKKNPSLTLNIKLTDHTYPERKGSSGFRSKFDRMLGGGFVDANMGKCPRSQKWPCC